MDNTKPDYRKGNKARLRLSARRKKRIYNFKKQNTLSHGRPRIGLDVASTSDAAALAKQRQDRPSDQARQESLSVLDDGVEWLSCQTDVNKLVQRDGSLEDDSADEIEPVFVASSRPCLDDVTGDISQTKRVIIDEVFTEEQDEKVIDVDVKPENLPPQLSDEWVIKKSLCRCCHAEGAFSSLQDTAPGEDSTYEHMLRSCFNLQLFEGSNTMGAVCAVCALCAARLRDAHAFSQQVRACEAHFIDLHERNLIKVAATVELKVEAVKEEPPEPKHDDSNIEMDSSDVDASEQLAVKPEVKPAEVQPKQKNGKSTATKKRKGKKPKEKKPKAIQSTPLKNSGTGPTPSAYYTRVGDSYKCIQCEKLSHSDATIRCHFLTIHKQIGLYRCALCLKRFKTKTQICVHKLEEHNIDVRFKCNACDKIFYIKQKLKIHMNTYHMMGEKIKCSMCDYECYRKELLRDHLLTHKRSRDFHCTQCKKSFMRLSNLRSHEKIHAGVKKHVCAECGLAFVQKGSLNYHMAKHHPEVRF